MTKDSMFSEKVQKTKLWDKFCKWYRNQFDNAKPSIICSPTIFLQMPFEFQEGVFRKFLLDEKGIWIVIEQDTFENNSWHSFGHIQQRLLLKVHDKNYQKASEEIILKCMDL